MVWYHGTTTDVLKKIVAGSCMVAQVYKRSNVSLGGAYFWSDLARAKDHAAFAARQMGGDPVVLVVVPDDLYPDEDWVVSFLDRADDDEITPLADFLDDLFDGYQGEGFSLSDHYKERYQELNDYHGITWKDSERWNHSARQLSPLRQDQVVMIVDVEENP